MNATLAKKVSDQIGYNTQNVNFAVKSSLAELMLTSNGIEYRKQHGEAGSETTADVAERVSRSVVQVLCYNKK